MMPLKKSDEIEPEMTSYFNYMTIDRQIDRKRVSVISSLYFQSCSGTLYFATGSKVVLDVWKFIH